MYAFLNQIILREKGIKAKEKEKKIQRAAESYLYKEQQLLGTKVMRMKHMRQNLSCDKHSATKENNILMK